MLNFLEEDLESSFNHDPWHENSVMEIIKNLFFKRLWLELGMSIILQN